MAHYIYPQSATSTTSFVLDGTAVTPSIDSILPSSNKGMPVVNLAGEGLGPLDVASGASSALTLRVVLSSDSTISIEEDKNYGVVGANTIRTAAQIGNATGAADFGSGADSAQTLRVTPSTRSETATTPLAVRLSDGAAFYDGATASKQDTIITSLQLLDDVVATDGAAALTKAYQIAGTDGTNAQIVSTNSSGHVNIADGGNSITVDGTVTANLGTIAGVATETTLSAVNGKLPATLGQKTMSASLAVTMASDQSSIPVRNGMDYLNRAIIDYSSTNVTTLAWTQLISTVGASIVREIEIFDSSGEILEIGLGASGSEVAQSYIVPGGNGRIPVVIPAGTRVAVRAVSATANIGYLTVNFYG